MNTIRSRVAAFTKFIFTNRLLKDGAVPVNHQSTDIQKFGLAWLGSWRNVSNVSHTSNV